MMPFACVPDSLPRDFKPIDVSQLPPGKTVLWDHHPCGPPVSLHFTLYQKPKVVIKDKILGLASHNLESVRCGISYSNFTGSLAINGGSAGYGITISLKYFEESPDPTNVKKSAEIVTPVVFSWKSKGHVPREMDHYHRALQDMYDSCKDGTCLDLGKMVQVFVSCTMQGIKCDVAVEMCTVDTVFKAIPVPPMSLQASSTDLYCDSPATGFITVDSHKCLHQVSENNSMIHKLPLVGIWMKGICSIFHPLVWAACIRYISSATYEQRLCLPPQPFLICLYNPLTHQPEFYDCISVLGNTWLTFGFERGTGFTTLAKVPIVDTKVTIAELTKMEEQPKEFSNATKCVAQKKVASPGNVVMTNCDDMPQLSYHPQLPKKINIQSEVPEISLVSEDEIDKHATIADQGNNAPFPRPNIVHASTLDKESVDHLLTDEDSTDVFNKSVRCVALLMNKSCPSNEESVIEVRQDNISYVNGRGNSELSKAQSELAKCNKIYVTPEPTSNLCRDCDRNGLQSKKCSTNENANKPVMNTDMNNHPKKVNALEGVDTSPEAMPKSRENASNRTGSGFDANVMPSEHSMKVVGPKPKKIAPRKSCLRKATSLVNSNENVFPGSSMQTNNNLPQKKDGLVRDSNLASVRHIPRASSRGMNTNISRNKKPSVQAGTEGNHSDRGYSSHKPTHSALPEDMYQNFQLQERLATLEKQISFLQGKLGSNSSGGVNITGESKDTSTSPENEVVNCDPSEYFKDSDTRLSMRGMFQYLKQQSEQMNHLERLIKDLLDKQNQQNFSNEHEEPSVSRGHVCSPDQQYASAIQEHIPSPLPLLQTAPTQVLAAQQSPIFKNLSNERLVHNDGVNDKACQLPCSYEISPSHIKRYAAVTMTNVISSSNPTHGNQSRHSTGPVHQECNLITTATMTSLVWPAHPLKCDNCVQTSRYVPDFWPCPDPSNHAVVRNTKSHHIRETSKNILPSVVQKVRRKTEQRKEWPQAGMQPKERYQSGGKPSEGFQFDKVQREGYQIGGTFRKGHNSEEILREGLQSDETPKEGHQSDKTPREKHMFDDTPREAHQSDETPKEGHQSHKTPREKHMFDDTPREAHQSDETLRDKHQYVPSKRHNQLQLCGIVSGKTTEVFDNDVQFSLQDIQLPLLTVFDTNQSLERSVRVDIEDYPATFYSPDVESSNDDDDNDSSGNSSSSRKDNEKENRKIDAHVEDKSSVPGRTVFRNVIGNINKVLLKQGTVEKHNVSLPEQQSSAQCHKVGRRYSENRKDYMHHTNVKHREPHAAGQRGETSMDKVFAWQQSFIMKSRYPVSKCRETDLSVEVNMLADKYLSEEDSEQPVYSEVSRGVRAGTWQSHKHASDLTLYGIDSTNMSIATKKYLDRHQLTVPSDISSKQFLDEDLFDSSL